MAISYRAAQNLIKRGDEAAFRSALDADLSSNIVNENGWTLLMLAAVEGSVALGLLLLERGAKVDARNKKNETALSIATKRNHEAFVALLQEHGATEA